MARGVPSRTELQKQIIIGVFTSTLGIVLGLMINTWWQNQQAKRNNIPMTGLMNGDVT